MSTRRPLSHLKLAAVVVAAQACAPAVAPATHVAPPAPPVAQRPPALPPAWTYWQPLDASVHGNVPAPELPYREAQVARIDGAIVRWSELSEAARAAVLERGFVVVPRAAPGARVGELYAALSKAGVPYVITLDALFWVAHVARDRALAAVEDAVLAPALEAMLRRLEIRLGAEARGAPGDLVAGYALARSVVSVARSLLSPAYKVPVDLARVVAEENRRIAAHAGPSVSPALGVTVDYSQIVPRGAADESTARAAYARAVSWLAAAPFVFAARGEVEGAQLLTSGARAHARAALLVARLLDFDVDVEAAYAWRRFGAVDELAGGAGDDVSPRELVDAAAAVGMNARDARAIVDVAKLDRLRHALLAGRPAHLDDGAAIAGVPPAARDYPRAATSARILPLRRASDAEVLQSLVFPSVGRLAGSGEGARGVDPPPSARDGIRAMPRALDVAAWLGAPDARALLHDARDDAYERYDAVLERLYERRPAESARHDSVYASSLDALATFLAPSAADPAQPGASGSAWRRRKLEAGLAGWTTLRHDALAFARFPIASTVAPAESPALAPLDLPAFVEPHPEAIAKLVALVRQTTRGMRALGQIGAESPSVPILDAAERLLADAFAAARRQANDEPLLAAERDALATFPARIAALERALVASRAADASLAVDVHTDLAAGRALVEACGDLDELYVVMREPRTGRLVLAVGASSTHYELTSPARERPTDATWRAQLHGAQVPARDDFTTAYVVPAADPATVTGGRDAGLDAAR